MRELVQQYLQRDLSRRAFVQRMVQSGFSLVAANSVLAAMPPSLAREGELKDEAPGQAFTRKFRGTGGELLAEQLLEADVDYLFFGNGTGGAPLADAAVEMT